MRRMVWMLIVLAVLGAATGALAADQRTVTSGRAVGEDSPTMVVLDVTGPHKGEAICYVCEWRVAPTILAFFQGTGDEEAALIAKLNDLVQKNAQKNLKAMGVFISGPENNAWIEKLAQEKGIKIPLVVFRKGKDDVDMKIYKLNPDAKNTFLINVNRKVNANLTNVTEATFGQVSEATAKMLAQKN